jgi:hypothetical protein
MVKNDGNVSVLTRFGAQALFNYELRIVKVRLKCVTQDLSDSKRHDFGKGTQR